MVHKTLKRLLLLPALAMSTAALAEDVNVAAVLVKLIEQVEVPAREPGVLEKLDVREGEMVAAGTTLARIEDNEAKIDKRRAQLELDGVRKQADSDVKIRYAKKSFEVAESELRRAVDSQKRLSQSVSQSELDQLRLVVQKTSLEIEQAQLEWELARTTSELKENELQLAEHNLQRRQITAPFAGFVAEVNRHRGEWVQPGQTVLRILRLDRLRAEGLVDAQLVQGDLMGRRAVLRIARQGEAPREFSGKIVFVSPEIDPVNGQVRIWAEIDNPELQLRPGMHGSLSILDASIAKQAK